MAKEIQNLAKRKRQETRFKLLGKASIGFALLFLFLLFGMIVSNSNGAFTRSEIALEVDLSATEIDHRQVIKDALKSRFPEVQNIGERNSLYQIVSKVANLELKEAIEKSPEILGKKSLVFISASSKADMFFKHNNSSALNENQLNWLKSLQENNQVRKVFNWKFFQFADSREPALALVLLVHFW
jgi:phosphate transport system permease protein